MASTPFSRRRGALAVLVACMVLSTAGCMTAQRAVPPSGGGSSTVVMLNQTDTPIYYVYISPCSSTGWGEDQLDASEVVQPGATRTFTMSPGCWDMKARFRDGREIEERQVYMSAGGSRSWSLTN